MSDPDHTDLSRLDLSDDAGFTKLTARYLELSDMLKELNEAKREHKELGERIIARLGNAKSALADGALVTTQTINQPEKRIKAFSYRRLMVRKRSRALTS